MQTPASFPESRRKALWGGIVLLAALALSAHGVSAQSAADYVIGPQDVLTIQVFDQADLGGKYTVEADGTFSFPLIGRVKAGGLTLRDVRGRAEDAAGRRLLQEPAGDRGGRAVPQPARVRHGRGAHARARSAHRRHDADRGARARRLDAADRRRARSRSCVARRAATGPVLPTSRGQPRSFRAQHPRARERLACTQNIALRDGDTIFVPRAETRLRLRPGQEPRRLRHPERTRRCCRRCRWPAASPRTAR